MIRDVDPSATGTFNQNALCSLIARRPKKEYSFAEIVQALKICANGGVIEEIPADDKKGPAPIAKIAMDEFSTAMETMGKSTGDDLSKNEVMQIINDCTLANGSGDIMIEDFAKYLISR